MNTLRAVCYLNNGKLHQWQRSGRSLCEPPVLAGLFLGGGVEESQQREKFEITNLNMKSGMSLKIKGKIHNNVDRFHINLGQGKETLNLHFNPRFKESTIVCNTHDGGHWGQEQRENHVCFSPGSEVKFTIAFQDKDFKVTLPDGHVLTFPNRLGHNHLHYLGMEGLQISSFKFE
ncbi:galectin-2 [Mastomys coucha]|uniref:galectin-2 n=1 Tax=Mastomys coucha TaxID=35658 RepID=UPI0012626AA7|nr:galectin-2 [Mastomys coucha]